eukprot:TRINITY_DN35687_c0_g1_i1.p1 TRINITY_DN35687_c0_g1~~TRINITY_DN35687_c0_g1_i1.p1  ORF type:complete len:432 (+),score=127.40 TRINITY_DN35687_c0_g1_i1:172-1467(+)
MKKVGRYKLTTTLGKGAFSVVLHGRDDTGREYAVKMCEKANLVQMDMLGELENEIAVLKRIRSRYIANLIDVIQTGRYYYLALDLCKLTLFTRITSSPTKRLEEKSARRYFQELLLAVYSCHQQGVMHRDIKPENILLTDDDHVKLSDFGFACPVEKIDDNKVQCGTRQYLAPEVFDLDQRTVDFDGFAADVWSCGVVLYAMTCGKLPFADHDPEQLKGKIRAAKFALPTALTPPCCAMLTSILTPDPFRRPTVFQIMALPWFADGFDNRLVDEINAEVRAARAIRIGGPAMPTQFMRHVPSALSGSRAVGFSPPQVDSFSYHASSASLDIARQGLAALSLAGSPNVAASASSLRCAYGPAAELRPHAHPLLAHHFDPGSSPSPDAGMVGSLPQRVPVVDASQGRPPPDGVGSAPSASPMPSPPDAVAPFS